MSTLSSPFWAMLALFALQPDSSQRTSISIVDSPTWFIEAMLLSPYCPALSCYHLQTTRTRCCIVTTLLIDTPNIRRSPPIFLFHLGSQLLLCFHYHFELLEIDCHPFKSSCKILSPTCWTDASLTFLICSTELTC
jgi:hypothetical protein